MNQAPACHHIMPSGKRCESPAMRGTSFCYFHSNLQRVEKARKTCAPMPFAPLEDMRGIQLALTQLFNLLDNPYSDTHRINQMLSVLRLATRVACHAPSLPPLIAPCPNCGHLPAPSAEPLEIENSDSGGFLSTEAVSSPKPSVDDDASRRIRECADIPRQPQQQATTPDPEVA